MISKKTKAIFRLIYRSKTEKIFFQKTHNIIDPLFYTLTKIVIQNKFNKIIQIYKLAKSSTCD